MVQDSDIPKNIGMLTVQELVNLGFRVDIKRFFTDSPEGVGLWEALDTVKNLVNVGYHDIHIKVIVPRVGVVNYATPCGTVEINSFFDK